MKDFLADYCEKNRKKINPKLFERSFDKPLVDYILDTFKNLEVLPGITMTSYEYITDQTKIHTQINKKNKRDPKIKNNKRLERLVTSGESIYDLLILHYHVKVRTQEADVTRRIWIPKLIDGRWYIRGGKKVLPLIESHMGKWDQFGRLPQPKTPLQTIVHICDYLASRKNIYIDLDYQES